MIKASKADKADVVRIIERTFDNNPSVNIVIGEKGNRKKKIKRLAEYAFIKSLNRDGVYLSNNRKGVALCFRNDLSSFSMLEIIYQLRFASAIPIRNVIQSIRRESYIKKHRLKGKFLYFWFFGVESGGEKAAFEIKDFFFELSKKEGLPIIMETSVRRNKIAYERYGFKVYHEWKDSGDETPLWFMVRKKD